MYLAGLAPEPVLLEQKRDLQRRILENQKCLRRRDDFPPGRGCQWVSSSLVVCCAQSDFEMRSSRSPLSLFHTRPYTVSLTQSLLLSLPLCRLSVSRTLTFTTECRLPVNTCKALGGSRTPNSMHSCLAGRRARDERRPAGRKDVGYEICSFYLARRHQWRANGTARLKSFAEKGRNIRLNHRNGTHSSRSNCSLYCGTQSGLFHFERHSSFKMPCKHADHMETTPTTWTLGNYYRLITWDHRAAIYFFTWENFYCFLQIFMTIIKLSGNKWRSYFRIQSYQCLRLPETSSLIFFICLEIKQMKNLWCWSRTKWWVMVVPKIFSSFKTKDILH